MKRGTVLVVYTDGTVSNVVNVSRVVKLDDDYCIMHANGCELIPRDSVVRMSIMGNVEVTRDSGCVWEFQT